ncbi:MAG: hypothetical protein Q4B54_12800 [Coriobacteriales bacterium]|nr:hypothetical protein [Coriobacteriales bacterium]
MKKDTRDQSHGFYTASAGERTSSCRSAGGGCPAPSPPGLADAAARSPCAPLGRLP